LGGVERRRDEKEKGIFGVNSLLDLDGWRENGLHARTEQLRSDV
jgi:hypothetical protein